MYNRPEISNTLFLGLLLLFLWLRCWQREGLWFAINTGSNLLPGAASALEVSEGLGQLQWLNHNALLLLVESDLGISGKGEILP